MSDQFDNETTIRRNGIRLGRGSELIAEQWEYDPEGIVDPRRRVFCFVCDTASSLCHEGGP